jgi:predicted RNA-binding protein
MESVDVVKTEGDRIFVQNIFGDQGWIKGRIKEMQLVQHRIVLEQTDQEE